MSAFKAWGRDAVLRAVKTAAQSAVAMLGVDQTGWLHADVKAIAVVAGVAAVVSVLHNLAGLQVPGDNPAQEG